MPNYKQKRTDLLTYPQFRKRANEEPDSLKRAFLEILFFSARRLSEVMRITQGDIYPTDETLYIQFWHLKKGTDKKTGKSKNYKAKPQQIPRTYFLERILSCEGRIFPFSTKWGYRTVKAIFPEYYPHFFRGNMLTQLSINFGDAFARGIGDITPEAQKSYSLDVDLLKVYDWQIKLSKGIL